MALRAHNCLLVRKSEVAKDRSADINDKSEVQLATVCQVVRWSLQYVFRNPVI
jgi:hypothetical protein